MNASKQACEGAKTGCAQAQKCEFTKTITIINNY